MFKIGDSLVSLRSLWRRPKALQEEGFSPVLLRHCFPRPGGNPGRSRRRGRWSREPSRCTGPVGCSNRCRLRQRRTIGFFSCNGIICEKMFWPLHPGFLMWRPRAGPITTERHQGGAWFCNSPTSEVDVYDLIWRHTRSCISCWCDSQTETPWKSVRERLFSVS